MIVSFLIAGVQKGGTSSLDSYLRQHPDISMAKIKEPHFFDNETWRKRFFFPTARYHSHFDSGLKNVTFGEATPIYTWWEPAVPRIFKYNKKMKIIVLLRDPVQRAWSHWRMEYSRKIETETFSEAIRIETDRARQSAPFQDKQFSYIDRGYYCNQIRRILRFFEKTNVLFIKSEEFFDDTDLILTRVCQFLEIKKIDFDTSETVNEGPMDGAMDQRDFLFLRDLYKNEVEEVERLLDWACVDWLSP